MPTTIEKVGWRDFRERLLDYAALDAQRRRAIVFRGQGSSDWPLTTSLDRWRRFKDDRDRDAANLGLTDSFRREMILADLRADLQDARLVELLARHHGLPSPLLDWTNSPYMAAFFAFEALEEGRGSHVAVWVLDRGKLPAEKPADHDFDFVDEPELLRFNPRALRQHGVFLRINSMRRPLEEALAPALSRFDIDARDARLALADLDAMRINASNLYGDLDGVCRTVISRMLE
jgi:hypothetical protein